MLIGQIICIKIQMQSIAQIVRVQTINRQEMIVQLDFLVLSLHVASVCVLYDQRGLIQFALLIVGQGQLGEAVFYCALVIARRRGRMKVLTKISCAGRRVDIE